MMTVPFLMDLLLAGLLVAMIAHGVILSRRLARLRADRDELAAVVRDFQLATGQAVAGLDGIRVAAETTGRALQDRVEAGRAAIRDLEFLVERGERAAERLESGSRAASRPTVSLAVSPAAPTAPRPEASVGGDAHSVLKAIEGMR